MLAAMAKKVRVALVNDYEIVLEGLRALLAGHDDLQVVDVEAGGHPRRAADVTLFDTYGEQTGVEDRTRALAQDPDIGALIVFSLSDHAALVARALAAGAHGFISKAVSGPRIVDGIRSAANGERVMVMSSSPRSALDDELRWPGRHRGLTARESELLALLPSGMTNRELGAQLYVSENTIKTQLRSLYSKLAVRNRTQAVARANEGLLGHHGD
jgi:DNA-binding NarL/FixJ family response regulator